MKKILLAVGIMGSIGVAIGALGAHSLKPLLTDIQLNSYETGVRYYFIHLILVLICLLFYSTSNIKTFLTSAKVFLIGIFLFSGSIFILSTSQLTGLEQFKKIIGPITPIGGLVLMAAWLLLAKSAWSWVKIDN